ncbi:MAG TPA: sigma-70 family RNA polymerase sigma factor [Gemmataceae bacterium]|nr:sigma-70 family RNA polymerase sigma factor [Gemmataceae bacterium]
MLDTIPPIREGTLMAVHLDHLLQYIHSLTPLPESVADGELLGRFVRQRDQEAFAELVRRHGPMVLGVCRRVLDGAAEAEDTFQAVFLVLARKAAGLRRPEGLAAWLHGVARHLALKCRRAKARRRRHETAGATAAPSKDPLEELTARELLTVLDEEIQRLPEVYRLPLILCGLEGLTHAQAARRLGWTPGSVKGRLLRGRQQLQERLAQRGLTLPAGLLVLTAGVAVPSALASATVDAAMRGAAGNVSVGLLVKAASLIKLRIGLGLLLAAAITAGAGTLALQAPPAEQAVAEPLDKPDKTRSEEKKEAHLDRYGDPLPPEARMRLGTVRFRAGGLIHACACSPDGKTVAAACANRTVYLFDAATGKPIHRLLGHPNNVTSLAYSPDGKTLASADANNIIVLWDLMCGKSLHQFPAIQSQGPVWSLAFSRDGKGLLAGGGQSFFCLHDPGTGKELRRFEGNKKFIRCLALSPDGKTIATAVEAELRFWDMQTGKMLGELKMTDLAPPHQLRSLAFSPDGKLLAVGGEEESILLWDVATRKLQRRLRDWDTKVLVGNIAHALAFSPSGKTLAAGHGDYTLRLWDVATGKRLRHVQGRQSQTFSGWHDGGIQGLVFTADGRRLIGAQDNQIVLLDAQSGEEVQPFEGHRGSVRRIFFHPDGRRLIATSDDPKTSDPPRRRMLEWDTVSGKMLRQVGGKCIWANIVAFSPDRKILVSTVSGDSALHLWDTATGKEIRKIPIPIKQGYSPGAIVFSPDGKRLAVIGPQLKELWLIEIDTGKQLWCMEGTSIWTFIYPCFSPDGRILAVAGKESMHWIDTTSGRVLRRISLPKDGRSTAAAITPDGRAVAVAFSTRKQQTLILWEIASGKERLTMPAPQGQPVKLDGLEFSDSLAFSPDGRLLAYGGWDRYVHLWDAHTGKLVRRWEGHHGDIDSLAFAPDGRRLASASLDTTVLIWDVPQLPKEKPRATPLTQQELEAAWSALASADAALAYRNMRTLQSVPEQTVPFLAERLRPSTSPDAERVQRLLVQLDSEEFAQRERATAELRKLGWAAEPALRKALADKPSLEARKRIQTLFDGLGELRLAMELVQLLRGIEVLEHTNTPAARRLLRKLADSTLGEGLVQKEIIRDAKASLERLNK